MHGKNKVHKGLEDRCTDRENGGVSCLQCDLLGSELLASPLSMWRGPLMGALGAATDRSIWTQLPKEADYS